MTPAAYSWRPPRNRLALSSSTCTKLRRSAESGAGRAPCAQAVAWRGREAQGSAYGARPIHAGRARKEITVAAPVDDAAAGLESYAEIFGRVVGLTTRRWTGAYRSSSASSRTEVSADGSLSTTATGLFSKHVRARVYADDGDTSEPLFIESPSPWDHSAGRGSDFADAAAAFRKLPAGR